MNYFKISIWALFFAFNLIFFHLGKEIGYQTASTRIYSSLNYKTFDGIIGSIVSYKIDEVVARNDYLRKVKQ